MDSKVPIETFEKVLELATEGAKAVATFMREVSFLRVCILQLLYSKLEMTVLRQTFVTSGASEDSNCGVVLCV